MIGFLLFTFKFSPIRIIGIIGESYVMGNKIYVECFTVISFLRFCETKQVVFGIKSFCLTSVVRVFLIKFDMFRDFF